MSKDEAAPRWGAASGSARGTKIRTLSKEDIIAMQYDKTVFDNGLRLVTCAMPRMESVAIGIWLGVGSRYETEKTGGIAHFLEHLVFKGSKKYSCQQIKELIEGVGGALNGFTSEEATCYFAKLPAAKQFQALDILSDMALNPLLKHPDIAKEKNVILEEIKMHKDLPQSYVHDLFSQLLWPDQPLGSSILGDDKTIAQINRGNLKAFQIKHYSPSETVIAACGRLKHKIIAEKIKNKFACLKKMPKSAFLPAVDKKSDAKIEIANKPIAQTHFVLGFYGLRRDHPDKYIYSLLNTILGANMSSRLFTEVREKRGLVYSIDSQIKAFNDTGALLIHAGIDNTNLYKAVALVIQELQKIKKNPVSRGELRRAKDFFSGQLRLALESTLEHMFWIGEPTLHLNKTYKISEALRGIEAATPGDLKRLAEKIFTAAASGLAVIGPLKEKDCKNKLYAYLRNL